jgi:transcriptional regulator with XRE-family HTH domain
MANFLYIKDLAEKKGITLRELAERAGIKYTSLYTLMKKGSTNTATLESIAKVLDVSAGYFFDEIPTITQTGNVSGRDGVHGHSVNVGGGTARIELDNKDKDKEIEHLKELLAEKEARIADKDKMIELLTSQIVGKTQVMK